MTPKSISPTVDELLSDDHRVQKRALEQIYAYCKPSLMRLMGPIGSNTLEAGDILQDAIAIVFQNVKTGVFQGKSSINTYTFSVCKKIWFHSLREESKMPRSQLNTLEDEESPVDKPLQVELLQKVLEALSPNCLELVTDFYYRKLKMEMIALKHGLDNPQIAKNKKWRCMKKLMALVGDYRLKKEDFYA